MKAYTDLSQSKKLAKILPLENADMRYAPFGDTHPWVWDEEVKLLEKGSVPCWSLTALMNVLDRGALFITPQGWACQSYINFKAITSDHHSNPIDACYEIILRLHELKML